MSYKRTTVFWPTSDIYKLSKPVNMKIYGEQFSVKYDHL